ncbi:MAG: methionine--tRNA ligase [Candidatus Omnitrophica bacterium]|nr:methionine--tRNA ligase [Candidatus Omnitrophota bacterium]
MKKIYITTPLYYVNAFPHIGHAYTQIICDAITRFKKQAGYDTFFMTGTDEHGEKIEKAAMEAGFKNGDEKNFVDTIVPRFKKTWEKLDIEYDYFMRTTDEAHENTVREVLRILYEKGKIYKKVYKGWFCTPCEAFWSESQASDNLCPDCKRNLERLDEENYFFKISEYQDTLKKHIKDNPSFILPEIRRNEVLGFLDNNRLQDLCISRPKSRMSWGIELPFDKNFVTYVWFDALINYISGAGFLGDRKKFDELWPADSHVIGKDILRHHAVYWPIMLMAIGVALPKHILTHGWWVIAGEKMSKSKGNIVDPITMIDKYGVDAFRYFLLSAVEFGYDGTFSEELFIEKYNADLANDLGNLVNRTLTMMEKYFGGVVPALPDTAYEEKDMKSDAEGMQVQLATVFAEGNSQATLGIIWEKWVKKANKYIEESAPWKLAKENDKKLKEVMYNLIQILALVALFLYPFMPKTSRNIWKQLGMESDISGIRFSDDSEKSISARGRVPAWGLVPAGAKISKSNPLFPRIISK